MSGESGNRATDAKDDGPRVTVYSTDSCPYCTMAKDYLGGKGVRFTAHDVGSDRQMAMEMMRKSGQSGVPVLDINGRIIVGFDRQGIDAALAARPPSPEQARHLFNDPLDK